MRFILRGGEINRNNNVTSNTANFPLFALAHTLAGTGTGCWLLASWLGQGRRGVISASSNVGQLFRKRLEGRALIQQPPLKSEARPCLSGLKSDWVTAPPSLAS